MQFNELKNELSVKHNLSVEFYKRISVKYENGLMVLDEKNENKVNGGD